MAFKCPACKGESLLLEMTLELPPSGGSDEVAVQTAKCDNCGFRGIAVYEESRRGSLTTESTRHLLYEVGEKDLQFIVSGIGLCPDRGNRRCQCETHLSWAKLNWLYPQHVTIKKWFRMEWVRSIMGAHRYLAFAFNSDLSFHEMIALPVPMGPWKWDERDKAWYYNLASIYEDLPSGRIKLDLIESGPNEVGGHVSAGGAGDPRQFAVSLRLIGKHELDSSYEREWERLRSAFVEVLLPSFGARDIRETEEIEP